MIDLQQRSRWEYRTTWHFFDELHGFRNEATQHLKALGAEGWEVVRSAVETRDLGYQTLHVILKRVHVD